VAIAIPKRIKNDLGLEKSRAAKRIFRQLAQQKFLLPNLKFCFWPATGAMPYFDII